MKPKICRNVFINVTVIFALTRLLAAGTPIFITFDPPGSTFTSPSGITPDGVITGSYNDASRATHGFVRARDGTISTFDGPNAVFGTQAYGINSAGVITGWYCDAINCYGFLRASDGSCTSFSVPGAVGTFPVGINDNGVVTGNYFDAAINLHNFVRSRDGTITTFDPGFVPNNSGIINPAGAITGYFFTPDFLVRSFVRAPNGAVTIFDAPSVCQQGNGTFATGINPAGLVVEV